MHLLHTSHAHTQSFIQNIKIPATLLNSKCKLYFKFKYFCFLVCINNRPLWEWSYSPGLLEQNVKKWFLQHAPLNKKKRWDARVPSPQVFKTIKEAGRNCEFLVMQVFIDNGLYVLALIWSILLFLKEQGAAKVLEIS